MSYFAENKILKTLPEMAKAAQSKDLKAAFAKHERETRGQIRRLQRGFQNPWQETSSENV